MATCQPDSLWSGFKPLIGRTLLLKHTHMRVHTHNALCSEMKVQKVTEKTPTLFFYPLLFPHNLLSRCFDRLEIEKWEIYDKLNEGWIPMCKPDRRRRGHAQKQQGEKPPIGAWKECDLLVLLSLLWQGDLSAFSPAQLSLFLFFPSCLFTPSFFSPVSWGAFFSIWVVFSAPKSVPVCDIHAWVK